MVIIEGYIRDSTGQQPLVGLPVEAFQQTLLGSLSITQSPEFTDEDGYFKIISQINIINETGSNVYIVVTDESKRFVSVRDRHSRYKKRNSHLQKDLVGGSGVAQLSII